jgi:hypothetical protein
MGGGSWNGKNFGGMHTGADKNANAGPYSNNGYRPDPTSSHLDFTVGDTVTYIGSEKYKHKSRVPTGCKGIVVVKDNMLNKRQKTSRSILKVDFGLYGINYVRKELLQWPTDYSECLEGQLEVVDQNESSQGYRNEQKKVTKGKLQSAKYKRILDNREKKKEFRAWRQQYLDGMKLDLQVEATGLKSSSEYKTKRKHYNKLKEEFEELSSLYEGSGAQAYSEASKECLATNPDSTREDIQKMFNIKKNKATRIIGLLKNSIRECENYFDESSKEYKDINEVINDGSRKYVREVSCQADYNNYLHHHYGQKDTVKPVDYKYEGTNPSRKYEVDPEVNASESDNINLLQWGLYPQDVSY